MKKVKRISAAVLLAALSFVGCQQAFAECGIASTYSSGTRTANGEHYNHMGISAAHKTLPFGTRVLVRNQRTGRSITVRINDRGPFVAGRIIDLSTGAKNALGMDGLASVCLEVVNYAGNSRGYHKVSTGDETGASTPGQHRHYAKAGKGTRSAQSHSGRKHLASARHGGRHYARSGSGKRYGHRAYRHREYASRD